MTIKRVFGLILILALPLLLAIACSENAPVGSQDDSTLNRALFGAAADAGDPLQFMAEVQTVDQNHRRLTFEGVPEPVVALQNAQITRLQNDNESPVPFESIGPGDNVMVEGEKHQDGNIYAHRLRICSEGCDEICFDVAFRGTIAAIDYAAGTFTVDTRTELITIDENTIVWGVSARWVGPECWSQTRNRTNMAAGDGEGWKYMENKTMLEFSDLAEGDVVEVRADIVDDVTLLAIKIKLAECDDVVKKCVEFTDYIASIDIDTRTVTFQNAEWSGVLCDHGKFTDLDGNPVDLDYFGVGDLVYVKGFPIEDEEDVLRICIFNAVAP